MRPRPGGELTDFINLSRDRLYQNKERCDQRTVKRENERDPFWQCSSKHSSWDFPGGSEAKTPSAAGPGSIPGWGTRSHMSRQRVHMLQLQILNAANKDFTCHNKKIPHAAMKMEEPECPN